MGTLITDGTLGGPPITVSGDVVYVGGERVGAWHGELILDDGAEPDVAWDAMVQAVIEAHGGPTAHQARELAYDLAIQGPDRADRLGLAQLQPDGSHLVVADCGRRWRVTNGVAVELVQGRPRTGAQRRPSHLVTLRVPDALHEALVNAARPGESVAAVILRLARVGFGL